MRRVTIRSILTLAAVAVAALALTLVQLASAGADPQARASATTARVTGNEFSFRLSARSIPRPGTVIFRFRNVGDVRHNFTINRRHTPNVRPGRSARLVVRFRRAGRYRYLCTVPGHAAAGMRGVFTVR
jgi:uncharacterized cupredoxin-like copper-binding protein